MTLFCFHSILTVLHCKTCPFCPNVLHLPQKRSLHPHQQVTTLCVLQPSSSGIQACYNDPVMLCDRPGRALAVCVNPDQSLPLLDGQRHQRAERSRGVLKPGLMWRAGRSVSQVNTLDWNWYSVVHFCEGRVVISSTLRYSFDSPVTGRIQKSIKTVCRIDWYSSGQDKPSDAPHPTGSLFSNETCKYGPLLTLP